MTRSLPRNRGVFARFAGVAAALTLAGCSAVSPSQTQTPYAATDGVDATVQDLAARNLIFLSAGKGKPGRLIGALVNEGASPLTVTFTSSAGTLPSVSVPANATVNLQDKQFTMSALNIMPGLMAPLTVTSPAGSQSVQVPVLDGTLPEYATLVPTATASASASK